MGPWCAMRDRLPVDPEAFRQLDAAQLVKHGYGLVTEARRRGKSPVLLCLFAERTKGRDIPDKVFANHPSEIACFAVGVAGATVCFSACPWRERLATFPLDQASHADRPIARLHP